jgi:hypothetical protein
MVWTVIANLKLYYTKISVAEGLNSELHFLFSIKNNGNKTYIHTYMLLPTFFALRTFQILSKCLTKTSAIQHGVRGMSSYLCGILTLTCIPDKLQSTGPPAEHPSV